MSQTANFSNPNDVDETTDDLKADLATLRGDLKALKDDIAKIGAARAETAKESIKEGRSTAEAQTKEALEDAASELQEIQRQAEIAVRKKPITAIASALAIGYFIASLRK